MLHPYYEYIIDLQNYQLREVSPYIIGYSRRYRDTFLTCLRKCNNVSLQNTRRKEIFRDSIILLYKPKTHVRAYVLMTPRGVIWSMGAYGYNYSETEVLNIYLELFYSCLNKAFELNLRKVTLRIPMNDYVFNKKLEDVWKTLGCNIKVRNSQLNNRVLYDKIRERNRVNTHPCN